MSNRSVYCLAAVLTLLLLQSRSGALDLTPQFGFKQIEGANIPILRFSDGEDAITYQPPPQWKATGGPAMVTLRPPDQPDAEFRIAVRPRAAKSAPIAGQGFGELQAVAFAELPARAEEISFIALNEGSFTIGPQPCREILCSFSISGRKYSASIALIDRSEKERLVILIHTRPIDFGKVRAQAIASLFSWQQGRGP
jgi:hypothetical protein